MRWIIAVIGSLIIWALSFDFLFNYSRLLLSIVIAIAGGLIFFAIWRAIKKPLTETYSLAIPFIFAAIGTGVFLLAASIFLEEDCSQNVTLTILCEEDGDDEISDDDICLDPWKKVTWNVSTPGWTVTIDNFKKTKFKIPYADAQPLNHKTYTGDSQTPMEGIAQPQKKGHYKYSITCTQGTQSKIIDPMIDIPKN